MDEPEGAERGRRVEGQDPVADVDRGHLGVELVVEGEVVLAEDLVVPGRDADDVGREAGGPGQRDERPGDVAPESEAPLEDLGDLAVVLDLLFLPLSAGQSFLVAEVAESLDPGVDPS